MAQLVWVALANWVIMWAVMLVFLVAMVAAIAVVVAFILGGKEKVSLPPRWLGMGLITFGVVFLLFVLLGVMV